MSQFVIDAQVLRALLRSLALFYSGDDTRYHLCALHMRDMGPSSKARLRFEATDGHKALVITPEKGLIKTLKRDAFFRGNEGLLLDAAGLKPIVKALKRSVKGEVSVANDGTFTFPNGDTFETRVVECQFPPMENVLPADSMDTCERDIVSLNPQYLMEVGKAAMEFMDGNDYGTGLNYDSTEELSPSCFVTRRTGVGTFRAVVMPMRNKRWGAEEKPVPREKPAPKVEDTGAFPADYHFTLTVTKVVKAAEQDQHMGFCIKCGSEHGECEPDTRERECQNCSEKSVYGAEELLLHVIEGGE